MLPGRRRVKQVDGRVEVGDEFYGVGGKDARYAGRVEPADVSLRALGLVRFDL